MKDPDVQLVRPPVPSQSTAVGSRFASSAHYRTLIIFTHFTLLSSQTWVTKLSSNARINGAGLQASTDLDVPFRTSNINEHLYVKATISASKAFIFVLIWYPQRNTSPFAYGASKVLY